MSVIFQPASIVSTPLGLIQARSLPGVQTKKNTVEYLAGAPPTATVGPNLAGESGNLFQLTGGGTIFYLQLIQGADGLRNDGLLRIYFDEALPTARTVEIPLCDLYCMMNPLALNSASASYVQATGKFGNAMLRTPSFSVRYSAWKPDTGAASDGMMFILEHPMPFTNCRGVIYNQTSTDYTGSANNWCTVEYCPQITSNLQFLTASKPTIDHTSKYANQDTADTSHVYDFLNLAAGNKGWILGHICLTQNQSNASGTMTYLERNVSIYVDGEGSASYRTSGTEDYAEGDFYWNEVPFEEGRNSFLAFFRTSVAATRTGIAHFYKHFTTPIRYNNGVIHRWEFQPDAGASRLSDNAIVHTTVFYMKEP